MPVLTRTNAAETPVAKKQPRKGATLMEYLMMISLIIVVCLVAVGYLGTANSNNMSSSSSSIDKAIKKKGG